MDLVQLGTCASIWVGHEPAWMFVVIEQLNS